MNKEKAEFIEHKDEKPGKGTPVDIPEGSIVKTIIGAVNELNEKAGLYELVIDKLENPIVFAAFNLGEEDEVATFYPATEDGIFRDETVSSSQPYLQPIFHLFVAVFFLPFAVHRFALQFWHSYKSFQASCSCT